VLWIAGSIPSMDLATADFYAENASRVVHQPVSRLLKPLIGIGRFWEDEHVACLRQAAELTALC